MTKQIQAIRGMNDCLPEQTDIWQWVESGVRRVASAYGYQEIRSPIVESTDLFKRSIGEVTDIVEKEMYTFEDRNGDSLTLRPEGTASCVRAASQHGLLYNQQQRLWYLGPMFRHERPQKGRYRQFHQFGVEVFGLPGPDIDAEVILLSARFWKTFGIGQHLTLELNSIGSNTARANYRAALVAFLQDKTEQLDEESKRRLTTNPLRILDSKNIQVQQALEDAPCLHDYLDDEARQHFSGLCERLDALGIKYRVNPKLVRGLDYYNNTVFEWVTDSLGAQGTVCAGGRYDGLVEQLGGKATPGVGFAMGLERLVLMLQDKAPRNAQADIYITAMSENVSSYAYQIGESLRDALSHLRILNHCAGGNFKKQMKRADNSGAALALIIGEQELVDGQVGVKFLRQDKAQLSVSHSELVDFVQDYFK